jgi:predicted esterase
MGALRGLLGLVMVASLLWLGCDTTSGDDDDAADDDVSDDDTGDDDTGDDDTEPVPPHCEGLGEGMNEGFEVDGEERAFILNLPPNVEDDGPFPVVFNFHGLGDTATNMSSLLSSYVDDDDFPFIAVTPEDTDYLMFNFPLDWAVFEVDENNKEARLFDEVMACIDARWGVDEDHVHTTGFSIGCICADMLGTLRGEQIASSATYSGGYWNNPANEDPMISWAITWPEYETENLYPQLFIHGGDNDQYDLVVTALHFNEYAEADSIWLHDMGHDVMVCDHGSGHTVPMTFNGSKVLQFFQDHPLGTVDSPYATDGLPSDWPDYCSFGPAD